MVDVDVSEATIQKNPGAGCPARAVVGDGDVGPLFDRQTAARLERDHRGWCGMSEIQPEISILELEPIPDVAAGAAVLVIEDGHTLVHILRLEFVPLSWIEPEIDAEGLRAVVRAHVADHAFVRVREEQGLAFDTRPEFGRLEDRRRSVWKPAWRQDAFVADESAPHALSAEQTAKPTAGAGHHCGVRGGSLCLMRARRRLPAPPRLAGSTGRTPSAASGRRLCACGCRELSSSEDLRSANRR